MAEEHQHELEINLEKSVGVIFFVFIIELIGGLLSGSLALLSDAIHMITDVVALALVLGATFLAKKHPSIKRTYGYHRVEVFVSVANGLLLIFLAAALFIGVLSRFENEKVILTTPMIITTVIGLLANLYVLNKLKKQKDVTTQSAVLHVLSDSVFSVIVLITGIIIALTGIHQIDSIVTLIFIPFIVYGAIGVLANAFEILFESAPESVNVPRIVAKIKRQKGIIGVHSVHVWTICPHIHIFTAHIQTNIEKTKNTWGVSKKIKFILKGENIRNSTLQFEYSKRKHSLIKKLEHSA